MATIPHPKPYFSTHKRTTLGGLSKDTLMARTERYINPVVWENSADGNCTWLHPSGAGPVLPLTAQTMAGV